MRERRGATLWAGEGRGNSTPWHLDLRPSSLWSHLQGKAERYGISKHLKVLGQHHVGDYPQIYCDLRQHRDQEFASQDSNWPSFPATGISLRRTNPGSSGCPAEAARVGVACGNSTSLAIAVRRPSLLYSRRWATALNLPHISRARSTLAGKAANYSDLT